MPESHPPTGERRRVTAIAVAATVAWGLAIAGLLATVPAAQSSTTDTSTESRVTRISSAPVPGAAVRVAGVAERRLERVILASTLAVFGDSVTARYNDVLGHEEQGFWSMAARRVRAEPRIWAEGGSGFVNPGLGKCVGHTFAGQLARPGVAGIVARSGAVIIEGGRTDSQTCRPGGGYDRISDERLRAAAEAFMAKVERLRGPRAACTFVLAPWGPNGSTTNRDRVNGAIREIASRHGFTFIETAGLLTEATTIEDGIHPNRQGNRDLTREILRQSDIEGCFG